MYFKIYSGALTRFIRDYHYDLIGLKEWGDGDSTKVDAEAFYKCGEIVWGLKVPRNLPSQYFLAYNTREGYFLFEIINIESLRRIGLAGFGEIINS